MAFSGYQVERLIQNLRRWGTWLPWRGVVGNGSGDRVRLSEMAERLTEGMPFGVPPPPDYPTASPTLLVERRLREPRVEYELERRAGSFMRPPVVPLPPMTPIPRAAPPPRSPHAGEGEDGGS